jgi:hypothetical protein
MIRHKRFPASFTWLLMQVSHPCPVEPAAGMRSAALEGGRCARDLIEALEELDG